MTRTALAFSPHLDDAAFSCGGTLARLARGGWRVVVATLFTRSMPDPQGFALACQLDKGLAPDVDYMALRRAEDRVAMEHLGAEVEHVALPEAPHRGYGSAKALFEPPLATDGIAGPLHLCIADLLVAHRPDLLLAPQAIGGHVDHVHVVRALGIKSTPVLWWRDFPYVTRSAVPAEPFRIDMAAKAELAIDLGDADRLAKEAACLAYESQLGFQFGGPAELRRRLADTGEVERFQCDGPVGSMLHPGIARAVP